MPKKRNTDILSSPDAPNMFTGEAPLESAHKVWAKVDKELIYALGPNVHRSWTGRLSVSDACAFSVNLTAPTRFIASKIETQYFDDVQRLWAKHDVVAPPRQITISRPVSHMTPSASSLKNRQPGKALASHRPPALGASKIDASENTQPKATTTRYRTKASFERSDREMALNNTAVSDTPFGDTGASAFDGTARARMGESPRQRFTFDNFVVGAPNEFAFAVARQIASLDEPQYNPVVLHGANGIGKTHLLYAVQNAVEASDPTRRVKLISSEKFVNAFVSSVRGGGRDEIEAFKSSLRDVDVLIIDDAHFIADKPGSQEELLHTLISLVGEGRQVLIAADRHPDLIEKASDRLKSYLCSGLVCKISAADYELRLRILDRLIARRRETANATLAIPQNARDHLAARINATPRDLEGAFNQVVAQSELLGTPITLETIQETLSDSRYSKGMRLTVDKIQRAVAEEFGIALNDMTSKRRARDIARPRQVAMYLCKKLTKRSLPDIGRRFGGRDHTTVMHAVKRVDSLRAEDSVFNSRVSAVETTLKG
ncbi:chromosomal replication initiator protein DnaA [Fretibacter rubidus]|uniref:chromosomal replication initiator protein DnaA n=1 Tax=Fretibacter rubidus TaxID=570162 RepID=UPI00352A2A82